MTRIIVTDAGGFIGARMTAALVAGDGVVALAMAHPVDHRGPEPESVAGVAVLTAALRDPAAVDGALRGVDARPGRGRRGGGEGDGRWRLGCTCPVQRCRLGSAAHTRPMIMFDISVTAPKTSVRAICDVIRVLRRPVAPVLAASVGGVPVGSHLVYEPKGDGWIH
ncbi:MAG: hypothetical protein WA890_06085 [Micromonospora sp.]